MERQAYNDKVLVLGIDGMDPKLTTKYVKQGIMPNMQKLMAKGASGKDLFMLGGHPTITPPMWTTLATGAYPVTHGISDFWMQQGNELDILCYGLDSGKCKAEQIWNVTAEAGFKTLVWHWPGSSWPPSSSSENLHVVDGTQPEGVNCGTGVVEKEFILVADKKIDGVMYKAKAADSSHIPCTIDDLQAEERPNIEHINNALAVGVADMNIIILKPEEGQGLLGRDPYDMVLSSLRPAEGWANAPTGAMEFTLLMSKGLIHRVGLVEKNEEGIYDVVKIYKNKKVAEPIAVLPKGEYVSRIVDEGIKNETKYTVERSMRVLDLAEDGSHLRLWVSTAMDVSEYSLWYPQELYAKVYEHCGAPVHGAALGAYDEQLMRDCMLPHWGRVAEWQADAMNYLIDSEGYQVVFSHFHSIDLMGHMIVKFLKHKDNEMLPENVYEDIVQLIYKQADDYVGRFMHYLDEGWTIMVLSDHGQACPEHGPVAFGEPMGVSVQLMKELGYTVLKKDENGNDLHEIDWTKTKAVAQRSHHIYINLKGRNPHGIVDPADKYELEEQIMTDLYGYKHPVTGKRVFALALRNKDALILGEGGDNSGDIIAITAEGYHFDHGDCLSTTYGYADTSVSPIFAAAGRSIKAGFVTERVIREVDVAPTIAAVLGLRMPAQCEGAPVYQILAEEF